MLEVIWTNKSKKNNKKEIMKTNQITNKQNFGRVILISIFINISYFEHDKNRQKIIRDTNKRHQEILL